MEVGDVHVGGHGFEKATVHVFEAGVLFAAAFVVSEHEGTVFNLGVDEVSEGFTSEGKRTKGDIGLVEVL